jgi:hypothetical protein
MALLGWLSLFIGGIYWQALIGSFLDNLISKDIAKELWDPHL